VFPRRHPPGRRDFSLHDQVLKGADASAEVTEDVEGLVVGQESLFGDERISTELHSGCWRCPKVADPVGVGSASGADDDFAGGFVVAQHNCDRFVRSTPVLRPM
jgi:hypothetical protein